MRVDQESAFVLHATRYRETSLLLEIFSRHHGRIGLVARGASRPKSGLRAILSPFLPLVVNWSGRGELATLCGAETDFNAINLTGEALYAQMEYDRLVEQFYAGYRESCSEEDYEAAKREFDVFMRLLDAAIALEHRAPNGS